jgi:hypothetical protein
MSAHGNTGKKQARIWVQPSDRFWYYKSVASMMEACSIEAPYKGLTLVLQARNSKGEWKTFDKITFPQEV